MSKVKTSGYARFIDDELEFSGLGYYSKFSKSKTKEHRGKPDHEKSKDKKKDFTEQRRLKRGE
jgi:hypothetical protein